MPFNLLVTTCACSAQKLRYKPKKGKEIFIHSENNEHVVFFEIDDKSNPISYFREHFGMDRQKEQICDLLIYYICETKKNEVRGKYKLICLVESKGLPINEAIAQIKNTYSNIKNNFTETDTKKYTNPIVWCAYIVSDRIGGSYNKKAKDYKEDLFKIIGSKNCDVSNKSDIGPFLRDCCVRLDNAKKKK